jgi:hypothetical protein
MRLPIVSGKATAAVVIVCLVLTALITVPLAGYFRMPPWIRFEIVLGVWWVIWVIALARLLHLGHRLSDDHAMAEPRDWFSGLFGRGSGNGGSWSGPDVFVVGDFEGCAYVLAFLVAVLVAIIGFWFLVEIAIPAIAFILYFLVRGMLARVANDDHGCQGKLGRALAWGGLWATLYIAPLAFLVWLGHVIVAGQAAGRG